MKENMETGGERGWNPWRVAGWSAAVLILLLPLVAIQFTDEVKWEAGDFIIAGALLLGVGVAFELAVRKTGDTVYRAAAGAGLAAALLLAWVNGAVGIIGSENNDINQLYGGVIAIGIIGALIARFRPAGMSLAMFAAGAAQMLVAVAALVLGMHHLPYSSVGEILGLNGFFALLWGASGWLFRRASGEQTSGAAGPVG